MGLNGKQGDLITQGCFLWGPREKEETPYSSLNLKKIQQWMESLFV